MKKKSVFDQIAPEALEVLPPEVVRMLVCSDQGHQYTEWFVFHGPYRMGVAQRCSHCAQWASNS